MSDPGAVVDESECNEISELSGDEANERDNDISDGECGIDDNNASPDTSDTDSPSDEEEEDSSSCITGSTSVPVHNQITVRALAKKSVQKKQHSQLRTSSRKSHRKLPTSSGRRGHKSNRIKLKQSIDVNDW